MFLRSQFYFFKTYFQCMDHLHCIIFSWNPKIEFFEMKKSFISRTICYVLVGLHLAYMCASSYVCVEVISKGEELSILSVVLHLLGTIASWYLLLFRSFYTTKASELVCIMNSIILLENLHFHSKQIILTKMNSTEEESPGGSLLSAYTEGSNLRMTHFCCQF